MALVGPVRQHSVAEPSDVATKRWRRQHDVSSCPYHVAVDHHLRCRCAVAELAWHKCPCSVSIEVAPSSDGASDGWRRCTVKGSAAPHSRSPKTGEGQRQCRRQPAGREPCRYENAGVSIQSRGGQVHGSKGRPVLRLRRYVFVLG